MLIVDVHFTFLILFKNGEIMIFHVVLLGLGKYIEMYTAKFVILVFCFVLGGFPTDCLFSVEAFIVSSFTLRFS